MFFTTDCVDEHSNPYRAPSTHDSLHALCLKCRYTEAVAECTEALDGQPNFFKALIRRAKAYEQMGQHKQALADLQRANKLDVATEDSRVRAWRANGHFASLVWQLKEEEEEESCCTTGLGVTQGFASVVPLLAVSHTSTCCSCAIHARIRI